jgi:hypothetical protein
LEEQVETRLGELGERVQAVTEMFQDALLLSNKTYFLEEVTKLKDQKRQLQTQLALLRSKQGL